MSQAFIIDALRTPMGRGKPGGALSGLHPVDLLGQVLAGLIRRNDLDPAAVDDVIVGCVSQVGEQSGNVGRMAWLGQGLPESVPSVTVERKCGSGQQAIDFGAYAIAAGAYDLVIAAGVESMSRVPLGAARAGADPFGPGVADRYAPGLVGQGVSSELVSAQWGLSRYELDNFAIRSHQRAEAARVSGAFDREILTVQIPSADVSTADVPPVRASRTVASDETIRPNANAASMGALRAAFFDEATAVRFPQLTWSTTAGNSSQLADGASALLLASEHAVRTFGLRPRARFRGFAVCGDDPLLMLTGPIAATERVLKRAELSIADIDHFEVNEAFASVPLAWAKSLDVDTARLNSRGGAIALGHPLGASGPRLMTTLLHRLEDTGTTLGLQTMCEAGGMANATIIERM